VTTQVEAPQHHPVVVEHKANRSANLQLRIADRITAFAGSMTFVYVHAVLFTAWMLAVEHNPWPKLTLIVSLEAIFLSTFVMISQNRADMKRQIVADQQWATVKHEDKQNQELLGLSRQILELTKQMHALEVGRSAGTSPQDQGPSR